MLFIILLSGSMILTDPSSDNSNFIGIFVAIILVLAILITLELLFMYAVFLRRFKYISVKLDEQGIIYTNIKEQIFIPYEDIKKIQFPSIKYTGGWAKIVYGNGNGNIRLTVVLENIGEFMSELKQKLDERNMMEVYNEKKYFSFYKTAVFADESWDRIYGNIPVQILTCLTSLVITIVILVLRGESESNKIYLYASIIVPVLGYLISEIIIAIQVPKRVVEESYQILPRNKESEKKLFMSLNIGATIIYIIGLFISTVFI